MTLQGIGVMQPAGRGHSSYDSTSVGTPTAIELRWEF